MDLTTRLYLDLVLQKPYFGPTCDHPDFTTIKPQSLVWRYKKACNPAKYHAIDNWSGPWRVITADNDGFVMLQPDSSWHNVYEQMCHINDLRTYNLHLSPLPDVPPPEHFQLEEDLAMHHDSSTYCRYLPIRIGNTMTTALVDSGNVWRSAFAESFLPKLGLTSQDVRPIDRKQLRTAKLDSSLTVVGELKQELSFDIGSINTQCRERPIVVRNMAMDFNLSGPFMKRHQIDMLHSMDAISIQGHIVPLLPRPRAAFQTRYPKVPYTYDTFNWEDYPATTSSETHSATT